MDWDPINGLFEKQHDLVAVRQLHEKGWTREAVRWAVDSQRIDRYRLGVYVLKGAAPSPYRDHMAAVLAAGSRSGASHRASAWMWGAEAVAEGPIEVITFGRNCRRLDGVISHRSAMDPDNGPEKAIVSCHDVPTIAPALTVVHLASMWTPLLVERVADDLVKKKCTTFGKVLAWIDYLPGVPTAALRAFCLRNLTVEGHDDSPLARKLGLAMLAAGIERFETQYRVQTPKGDVVLDYAWVHRRVALEFNGFRDHGTRRGFDRDADRTCRLAALGWRVLPVTSVMNVDEVICWVKQALAVAPTS